MVSRYLEFEMMRHFVFIFLKEKKKNHHGIGKKKERGIMNLKEIIHLHWPHPRALAPLLTERLVSKQIMG